MKKSCSILVALGFGLGMSAAAFAASVGGGVASSGGQPISGIQIIAKNASGQVVGQAAPGAGGAYNISGLSPGDYSFTLDPGSTGFQGQTVTSYMGPDGLCINWAVSTSSPAVATAQPGSTCQPVAWLGTPEMVAAGAGLLAAGAIGAAVGLSGSSGASSHKPKSPAQ